MLAEAGTLARLSSSVGDESEAVASFALSLPTAWEGCGAADVAMGLDMLAAALSECAADVASLSEGVGASVSSYDAADRALAGAIIGAGGK